MLIGSRPETRALSCSCPFQLHAHRTRFLHTWSLASSPQRGHSAEPPPYAAAASSAGPSLGAGAGTGVPGSQDMGAYLDGDDAAWQDADEELGLRPSRAEQQGQQGAGQQGAGAGGEGAQGVGDEAQQSEADGQEQQHGDGGGCGGWQGGGRRWVISAGKGRWERVAGHDMNSAWRLTTSYAGC